MSRAKERAGGCSCFSVTITLILFFWLGFWHSSPTITLEHLDVFSLNTAAYPNATAAAAANRTVYFDVRLKNRNFNKRVHYDSINITLYYYPGQLGSINGALEIGNVTTFPPFQQGVHKSTHLAEAVEASKGVVEAARAAVEKNGSAVFRVGFATAVRYTKLYFWKTSRHGLDLRADVAVNAGGSLMEPGLKLTSGVGKNGKPSTCYLVLVMVIASWVLLLMV